MKHNICVIDDSIPLSGSDFIDDTKLADSTTLKYLLNSDQVTWDDSNVKSLIKKVVNDTEHWNVTAFKTPSFYFNHASENILSTEIIIFDWDYDGSSASSEENLLKLLKTTYSIIHVYTNADKKGEVTDIIKSDKFNPYTHRLGVIQKEDDESVRELLKQVNKKYRKNFSYRFGKELRNNVSKSVDEIMIEISKLSVDDFVALFGVRNNGRYSIPTLELVSIITEKIKHHLLQHRFSKDVETIGTYVPNHGHDTIRKVWSYRLYHYPKDKIVRKGDIISKKRGTGKTLYLVLSSDCHLDQFWNKNFGYITLVPLHKLDARSRRIKQTFIANKAGKLNNFRLDSLTNPVSIEGITILPGIRDNRGQYHDYLLNTKEVTTVKIKLPRIADINNRKNQLPLLYTYWKGYKFRGRIRVSEPFLSPLVQFIMDYVTGYGCPDFPETLQNQLKSTFDEARR